MTALDPLFSVAERENPLRRFLFVSHVLGKHLPIEPNLGLLAGAALALKAADDDRAPAALAALDEADAQAAQTLLEDLERAPAQLDGPVSVIGFAETATALGHAVADAFDAAALCHTTRREIPGVVPALDFTEDHSHAPEQWLYTVPTADGPVVLVDDELTTGRTACNLIRELQRVHPRDRYIAVSLIDRLGPAERQAVQDVADELGCRIDIVSLRSARTAPVPAADAPPAGSVPARRPKRAPQRQSRFTVDAGGVALTARQGLDRDARAALRALASRAGEQLNDQLPRRAPVTLLGFGEFMFLPLLTGADLARRGRSVRFWSTTRSPIRVNHTVGYPIQSGVTFPLPEARKTSGYLYSTHTIGGPVVLCPERWEDAERASALIAQLGSCGVDQVVTLLYGPSRHARVDGASQKASAA